jgi:hypothetical protein
VKLLDLVVVQGIAVLLWVNLGMVKDLVPRIRNE